MAEKEKPAGSTPKSEAKKAADLALETLSKAVQAANEQTQQSGSGAYIAAKQKEARSITDGLQNHKAATEQFLKALPKEVASLTEAKQQLAQAAATPGGKEVMKWLGVSESQLVHSPEAITLVARIAEAPVELQHDPHFLLAESAKLYWSTDWNSLTPDAHREIRLVMYKIYNQIEVLRPQTPDFERIQKETVEQIIPQEQKPISNRGASASLGFGPAAYEHIFEGNDAIIETFPDELRSWIYELRNHGKSNFGHLHEPDIKRLFKELENSSSKFTADQRRLLTEWELSFERRQREIQAALEDGSWVPNRLHLDPDIAQHGKLDPIGTSDTLTNDLLKQIFDGNEMGPPAIVAKERLELLQYLLFSPTFDERRLGLIEASEGRKLLDFREKFLAQSKSQQEKFARSFTIRYKAATWWGYWKDAAALNDKRYQEYVNRMDEDDFFGLDGLYGGLVGKFRRAMAKNYTRYIFDDEGQRRGMDPRWWDKAFEDTVAEMRKNKGRLAEYKKYRMGESFKTRVGSKNEPNTLAPIGELSEKELKAEYYKACEAIGNLSKVRMVMGFEKANLDSRFAPPKWAQSQGDIPSDFLEKQKLLRLSHPYENHLMQWNTFGTSKTELEWANIRHRAEIWLESMPEARQYGDDWAEELWGRIESWKQGTLSKEQGRILAGQIDAIYFFKPDPLRRPPPPGSLETEMTEKMDKWLRKLSKTSLQEEARIYTGMQLSQRFDINPYFMMFESGYRRDSQTRFLDEALAIMDTFAPLAKKRDRNGVFDAGTLVGATMSYKSKLASGDSHGAKESFLNSIASIAHTRPHDLIMALKEGHSRTLPAFEQQYFAHQKGGFVGAYSEIASCFDEIRDGLLENKFHTQIDYYQGKAGLDDVQKRVATELFREKFGVEEGEQKMTSYFDIMKTMSHHLLGEKPPESGSHGYSKWKYIWSGNNKEILREGQQKWGTKLGKLSPLLDNSLLNNILKPKELYGGALQEFANPGYIPMLSKGRWDDFPYDWLQETERIFGMLDPEGKVLTDNPLRRISELFIGAHTGDEQSGPCRRMHRDAGGAQDVIELFAKTMIDDEKTVQEALVLIQQKIQGFQGPDAAATSTDVATGARIRTMMVNPLYGAALEKVRGACEMSKHGFINFKAISADEGHKILTDTRAKTYGVLENAPSIEVLAEKVEKVAKISDWENIFRTIDLIPGLGQVKRAVEVGVGHARWGRFKEYLNSRLPTNVGKLKVGMAVPFLAVLFIAFLVAELQQQGEGSKKKSHP